MSRSSTPHGFTAKGAQLASNVPDTPAPSRATWQACSSMKTPCVVQLMRCSVRSRWTIKVDYVEDWLLSLDGSSYELVMAALELLEERGPTLGRPLVDRIHESRHQNMKELRPGSSGRSELRILFAFDRNREAILLVGGRQGGTLASVVPGGGPRSGSSPGPTQRFEMGRGKSWLGHCRTCFARDPWTGLGLSSESDACAISFVPTGCANCARSRS